MIKGIINDVRFRYLAVGATSYAIELVVLASLTGAVGLHRTLATAISFWISIVVSFQLQRRLAFSNTLKGLRHITRQGTLYIVLVGFNYVFTLLVVSIFNEDMLFVSRTLAIILVTIWNFFVYKKYIFNVD